MPHRLKVWRDTGQRDRFGQRVQEIVPTENGLLGMKQTATDIRCRLTGGAGARAFDERSVNVIAGTATIFCDPGADVNEADRVQVYEPTHGDILIPDGIVTLIKRVWAMEIPHHMEINVRVIRATNEQGEAPPIGGEGTATP